MEKQYFIKLLQKYRQGNVTREERQFLESYYNLFQNEPDLMNKLSEEEKKEIKEHLMDGVWDNISENERGRARRRSSLEIALNAVFDRARLARPGFPPRGRSDESLPSPSTTRYPHWRRTFRVLATHPGDIRRPGSHRIPERFSACRVPKRTRLP